MRILTLFTIIISIGLAFAGHFHHHDHGGVGKEVGYSVVTSHGSESVHGSKHGGRDGGHGKLYISVSHGKDDGDSGDYGGHKTGGNDDGHDHHAYPKYEFDYGVKDSKTGDIKSQSEARDGDKVKGSYSLKEADGTTRHVEYTADKKKGFTAVVHKVGKPDHGNKGGHAGHGDHGAHGGKASSYIVIKKQEEKKH